MTGCLVRTSPRINPAQLLRLISKGKWDLVLQYLDTKAGRSMVRKFQPQGENDDTLLHLVCMHRPPLDVLTLVFDEVPEAAYAVNALYRTPLHTAAAYAASTEVMKRLIYAHPQAVSMPDHKGKTPLILACGGAADELGLLVEMDRKEKLAKRLSTASLVKVVKMLGETAPEAMRAEDDDGVGATEYALLNEVHLSVFKALRRQTKKSLDLERQSLRSAAA